MRKPSTAREAPSVAVAWHDGAARGTLSKSLGGDRHAWAIAKGWLPETPLDAGRGAGLFLRAVGRPGLDLRRRAPCHDGLCLDARRRSRCRCDPGGCRPDRRRAAGSHSAGEGRCVGYQGAGARNADSDRDAGVRHACAFADSSAQRDHAHRAASADYPSAFANCRVQYGHPLSKCYIFSNGDAWQRGHDAGAHANHPLLDV